jgi:flagellum-specific peptidoglycan hydrolase FlgJ
MHSVARPRWQHVTALVSLSVGGAITGFSFVPGTVPDLTSPAGMPISLLAMQQTVQPAHANEAMLRSAIVNVANYFLRMAKDRTPAEMEAIIWQNDSIDGANHGQSCAAFASLTLELAAQVVGRQSWVTGGTSYPWPLQKWADVRVDPNPASLGIISIRQDAAAHDRWHPLGDGYEPLPGDWVLFKGHVEVVSKYSGGVLKTVGGDTLPNFSVNAHEYPDPLGAQGVTGFVNNGALPGTAGKTPDRHAAPSGGQLARADVRQHPRDHTRSHGRNRAALGRAAIPATTATSGHAKPTSARRPGGAAIPATRALAPSHGTDQHAAPGQRPVGPERAAAGSTVPVRAAPGTGPSAQMPGTGPAAPAAAAAESAAAGTAAIPGLSATSHRHESGGSNTAPDAPYRRHHPAPATMPPNDMNAQQEFIGSIAPGAVATQRKYGVPAAVTIAQAIDESGWGQSSLATKDHNLFGIKGTGPAGGDSLPTQEYVNGRSVASAASFRVYHDIAEGIDDHGKLLATSGYYTQAMADRHDPNAFAAALTGVYATDPDYGAKLIGLMRRHNLYRYDNMAPAAASPAAGQGGASIPGQQHPGAARTASTPPPASSPSPPPAPSVQATPPPEPSPGTTRPPAPSPGATEPPAPSPSATTSPAPSGSATPPPAPSASAASSPSASPQRAARTDADQPDSDAMPSAQTASASRMPGPTSRRPHRTASRGARSASVRYRQQIPLSVKNAFVASAKVPLSRAEPLYRDVASHAGIRWELLAACDWMQCRARPRYSPVHGEKLGTENPGGTIYRTRSAALERCADDLVELSRAVYRIDLDVPGHLSVCDLANVFAAFRWGRLLKLHHTSAMEFPYSVAGLSDQHVSMRWPNIAEPNAPDKPGARFRMPFGAVPVMLILNYPATD